MKSNCIPDSKGKKKERKEKNSVNQCTELAKHSNKGSAQSKQGMEKHGKSCRAGTQVGARQPLGASLGCRRGH